MKNFRLISIMILLSLFLGGQSFSQGNLLKKIKSKAEDKAVEKIFKEDSKDSKSDQTVIKDQGNKGVSKSGSKSMQNTEGGGLTSTQPDVLGSIKSARTAYEAKNYAEAKYAVKQALMGVELEIGQNILKSLPEKVDGLPKVDGEDNLNSSGTGFIGMTIQRTYRDDKKELSLNILNDANMMMGINMYLNNPGMSNGNNDKNMKQIQFKGNRGLIEYDQGSGYSLTVPFGQSSLFVVRGVNYKNETEFMTAANTFDLEKIKTELGEK